MISISLIDPLKPETPVDEEPGLAGFVASDDPPPHDIRITQVKVMKYFIIYSQKN